MTKPQTRPVSLSLPPVLTERLDDAAEQFMQTRSSLVRLILEGWLANFEHPVARETLATLNRTTETPTHADRE